MLHNILGFGGRMGRLEYFMASLALGFFVMLLVFALMMGFMPDLRHGDREHMPPGLMILLLGVVMPIWLWFALAFQAKRYRDMGWNPLYVIPGSIAVVTILTLLSPFVHGLAGFGLLLNFGLTLCLWFWPSAPTGTGDWYGGSYHEGPLDPEPVIDRAPALTSRRPATVRTPPPPPAFTPAPSGFGRRGL